MFRKAVSKRIETNKSFFKGTTACVLSRFRFSQQKTLQAMMAQRVAPVFLDPLGCFPLRYLAKVWQKRQGRSSGSRFVLLSAPSRFFNSGIFAEFVPDYSGGTAPDSHGIPLSPYAGRQVLKSNTPNQILCQQRFFGVAGRQAVSILEFKPGVAGSAAFHGGAAPLGLPVESLT